MLLTKLMAARSAAQVCRGRLSVGLHAPVSFIQTTCTLIPQPPQIVCMSATMAGLEPMADWLNSRLFLTNFRWGPAGGMQTLSWDSVGVASRRSG
jgi:hypothetical protein